MSDKHMKPDLWTERPVNETLDVYADWAESYDADVTERGYVTPARIAEALMPLLADDDRPVLDYGCGTGLSGRGWRHQPWGSTARVHGSTH